MKLLMVSVGQDRYAVPADIVTQILDPALESELTLEASEAVYRGERFPLRDVHPAAGGGRGVSRVYLVLERLQRRAIMPVDEAHAIREIPAAAIAPLPQYIFARPGRVFRGVFSDGGEPRLLLDRDGLL